MTALQILDKAVRLGVQVVQIGDNLPLEELSNDQLKQIRERAVDAGIELELAMGGIAADSLKRHLEIAELFNAKVIRTLLDSNDHRPNANEAVSILHGISPEFESLGVSLAVENHDRFHAHELADIIDRIDSPCVGVCLDTANSLSCLESPDHVVNTLARHTVNLHVKDFRYRRPGHLKGFIVEGCPVGEGQLDFPWLLGQLRQSGRDYNAIIELWPPEQSTVEGAARLEDDWATESVRYLRQFPPD